MQNNCLKKRTLFIGSPLCHSEWTSYGKVYEVSVGPASDSRLFFAPAKCLISMPRKDHAIFLNCAMRSSSMRSPLCFSRSSLQNRSCRRSSRLGLAGMPHHHRSNRRSSLRPSVSLPSCMTRNHKNTGMRPWAWFRFCDGRIQGT